MKRIRIWILLLAVVLLTAGCAAKQGPGAEITVTLSIECRTALDHPDEVREGIRIPADGIILEPVTVTLNDGDTVYDAVIKGCREADIPLKIQGSGAMAYIMGIAGIREMDVGRESGWIYYVDQTYAQVGAGQYVLHGGEVITFRYTCANGRDLT